MNHIAAIHTISTKLGQSREDYQALLVTLTGKPSTKDMNATEVARVRAHYDRLAVTSGIAKAQPARSGFGRPRMLDASKLPMIRRIRAQLISLDRKPDSYADGILTQMYASRAPASFEHASMVQLRALTAALGKQQTRDGAAKA